jgi:hypothetical protein
MSCVFLHEIKFSILAIACSSIIIKLDFDHLLSIRRLNDLVFISCDFTVIDDDVIAFRLLPIMCVEKIVLSLPVFYDITLIDSVWIRRRSSNSVVSALSPTRYGICC